MQSNDELLLSVKNVSKKYARSIRQSLKYGLRDSMLEIVDKRKGGVLREDEFWALQGVNFKLYRGDCIGIMGRNGAGKSTLLKVVSGILKPDTGEVNVYGRMEQMLETKAGFKNQLTGRENVKIRAKLLGMSSKSYDQIIEEIEDFTELGEFMDMPVEFYSSGMKARLGFAVSTMTQPDILIIDEVLAVGDLPFRLKCYDRLGTIIKKAAVIVVSHSIGKVKRFSNRGMYIKKGRMEYCGELDQAISMYQDESAGFDKIKDVSVAPEKISVRWLVNNKALNDQATIIYGNEISAEFDTSLLPDGTNLSIRLRVPGGDQVCEWSSSRAGVASVENNKHLRVQLGKAELCPGYYGLCAYAMDKANNELLSMSTWTHFKITGQYTTDVLVQKSGEWETFTPEKPIEETVKGGGERQAAPDWSGIRADHTSRYELACNFIPDDAAVLDICCGVGYGSKILAEKTNCKSVQSVDKSEDAINYGRTYYSDPKITFHCSDCFEAPLEKESFDAIVSFETVEHIQEDKAFIERLHTLLKPNGTLILSTPNEELMPYHIDKFPFHFRHYTPNELKTFIESSGFSIENVYSNAHRKSKEVIDGWNGPFNIVISKKQVTVNSQN